MTINSLKELEKIIQLCRKQGVETFQLGEISFTLGPNPKQQRQRRINAPEDDFPEANMKVPQFMPLPANMPQPPAELIKTDELTDEQRLYWSATAHTEGS